jgi:hypothetical protein
MIMEDVQLIRFMFSKIVTNEFAVTGEKFDETREYRVTVNLGFGLDKDQRVVNCSLKAFIHQEERLLTVVGVTCAYKVLPEDWDRTYKNDTQSFVLSKISGLYLAGLTVSTVRGILHGKTESLPINAALLPMINVQELVKADIKLEIIPSIPVQM